MTKLVQFRDRGLRPLRVGRCVIAPSSPDIWGSAVGRPRGCAGEGQVRQHRCCSNPKAPAGVALLGPVPSRRQVGWVGWERLILLRLQLPGPPGLSQGWAGATEVAAFPGPARAGGIHIPHAQGAPGWAARCAGPRPGPRPGPRQPRASSAPWPCKGRVWQLLGTGCGKCWPCRSLLGGVQAGGGGSLLEPQSPQGPGPSPQGASWGSPAHPLFMPPFASALGELGAGA